MNHVPGTAPIIKNSGQIAARGMTPIEKNIIVVDDKGNILGRTWPKRAEGLIKKGRARRLDSTTVCLACPPENPEERIMDKDTLQSPEPKPRDGSLTPEDLLRRMDVIRGEMQSLPDAIRTVDALPEDSEAGARAEAIGKMFCEREVTCRQQLSFLERVYTDHCSGASEDKKAERIRMILEQMNSALSGSRDIPDAAEALIRFYRDLTASI